MWKIIDARNQMTEYGYDDQGRLETILYADGKTVTLSYDADGKLVGYDDGVTSATYTYDDLGRKLSETVDYGTFTKELSYTYYNNGLKKTFTGPDGITYEYGYGSNNELKEVRIPGVGAITIPEYTWIGPKTVVFPGGSRREYEYDSLMRLKALTATDPGGNLLLDYEYTYDSRGNIVTKDTEHGTYTYGYDGASRLISANNPLLEDETYTYDALGNRLTAAGVAGTWSYNQNNELLGYADVSYDYDENGNLTHIRINGEVVFTYIYDAANLLVHVEDGTGTINAEYYYDPFGRRLWKDVNGIRTYFCYSNEGLIGEYDADGNELRAYGYKPNSFWTTNPLFLKQDGNYYFYQNDHLGTPQKLTAVNGSVVWAALYNSFGEAIVEIETITNNLRFPGQYYDAETGLHYDWFRYYNPKIGRYLQADPLKFLSGDANLYRSVWSNPVNWFDPLGLFSSEPSTVETVTQTINAATRSPEVVTTGGAVSTGVLASIWATLTAPVSTLVAGGAAGIATVAGSVLAVGAVSVGAGLLINEFVVEPYIAEPIFDMIWPEGSPTIAPQTAPHPSPTPSPNPTETDIDEDQRDNNCDDFGRQCPDGLMKFVTVYVKTGGGEHTSLEVENMGYIEPSVAVGNSNSGYVYDRDDLDPFIDRYGWAPRVVGYRPRSTMIVGWWPLTIASATGGRWREIPDGRLVSDWQEMQGTRQVLFFACPESRDTIRDRVLVHSRSTAKFNIANYGARNCAGWVCQILLEAGWAPETGRIPGRKKLYLPAAAKKASNLCQTPGISPSHYLSDEGPNDKRILRVQREIRKQP